MDADTHPGTRLRGQDASRSLRQAVHLAASCSTRGDAAGSGASQGGIGPWADPEQVRKTSGCRTQPPDENPVTRRWYCWHQLANWPRSSSYATPLRPLPAGIRLTPADRDRDTGGGDKASRRAVLVVGHLRQSRLGPPKPQQR
jgi:hypothetical protein